MLLPEKWITLPEAVYPDRVHNALNVMNGTKIGVYTVARFSKRFTFAKKVTRVDLRFSGDTAFDLWLNGALVATGPAPVGGDFLFNDAPRDTHYASTAVCFPKKKTLAFFARVKMAPVSLFEYSRGRGGFMLACLVTFEDGTETVVSTDESWLAERLAAYTAPFVYDATLPPDKPVAAAVTENVWHAADSPLRPREERRVRPSSPDTLTVPAMKRASLTVELPMIYAGFITLSVKAKGRVEFDMFCRETDEEGSGEHFVFDADGDYRGLELHSAGKLVVTANNLAETPAVIKVGLIETHYPVDSRAGTVVSDKALCRVLDTCAHTLMICRQNHHLDSPRHQEPLACTGDYYIESLMTAMSFGDMTLAAFDVRRTALLLREHDGRMFHTTYSLIWARMVYDVYRYTGEKKLLEDCEDALVLLLRRFETYLGENGLIETPPDYMFVDWIYIDGFSLHHPPKALGQTCLNLFYFDALAAAAQVFAALGKPGMARDCRAKRASLKKAVNTLLYDAKRGLYFEGLNTPTPEGLIGTYMPQNTGKRYYLKQSNILACAFGACSETRAKKIIEKIMTDDCPGEYQPYFAHFLLEAILRNGLREKYTRTVLEKWKAPVKACPKGLVEGFVPPEPTYAFDHSHAWGGTPLYALPMALTGLRIEKPGMTAVSLAPSLLGFSKASVGIPTPKGTIRVDLEKGKPPRICAPKGVRVTVRG